MDETQVVNTILLLSLFMLVSALYVGSPTTDCIDCLRTVERGFPLPWLIQSTYEGASHWTVNWGYFLFQLVIMLVPAMLIGKASRKYELV